MVLPKGHVDLVNGLVLDAVPGSDHVLTVNFENMIVSLLYIIIKKSLMYIFVYIFYLSLQNLITLVQ